MKLYGIRSCLVRDNQSKIPHWVRVEGYKGINTLQKEFLDEDFAVLKIWSKDVDFVEVFNFLIKRKGWTVQRNYFFIQFEWGNEGQLIKEDQIKGRQWLRRL